MNEGRRNEKVNYVQGQNAHGALDSELKILPPAAPPPWGGLLRSSGMGHVRDMPRRPEEGKLARRDLDLRGSYGWSV